jgi:multicomponent Na+:H+ antiporter subunit F
MSAAETILSFTTWLALALLVAAFLLTVWRVVQGPTLPDRVVALDMLVGIVIGFIALIAIRTGFTLYIDIAIALGLVGFLATVAFARFILVSKARQKVIIDLGEAPLEGAAPVADAAYVEAVGAAARGAEKKSKAKSARNSAGTEEKPEAKTASKPAAKRSTKRPVVDEISETVSASVTPVEKSAAKTPGKSSDGSAKKSARKPQSKSIDKSASKSSNKSNSKTTDQLAQKPVDKATGKPRKPAKGE